MKRVLVTGATGFIGKHVMTSLVQKGVSVTASSTQSAQNTMQAWKGDVNFVQYDLTSYDDAIDYFQFFGKPDILIHLAWSGLSDFKDRKHIEEILPMHFCFLENMVRNGLQDLLVTGTCLEYGLKEGALTEDMSAEPVIAYAIAKDLLQQRLTDLQLQYRFTCKWVRLFYMFGKGQNPKSLLSQLQLALDKGEEVFNMSKGDQSRDYLPVKSVAEYIVRIALQTEVTGIINCCSGRPTTVINLVEEYLKRKNKTIKLNTGYYNYPDYEPMHFWGDDSKLKTILYE